MGKSIKTPPPKFNVVFIGTFVVFKWDFLLSTKYCILTLIFWDCYSKSFLSYLKYSGIVDSKKFYLKTTKWKCLLSTFPEYQSKKKISNNIESGGGGGDLLPKEGLTVLTCCNFQLVFARIVAYSSGSPWDSVLSWSIDAGSFSRNWTSPFALWAKIYWLVDPILLT